MTVSPVYATEQGLGRLAKSFYDHKVVDRVMIIHHSRRENHYDWYDKRVNTIDELLDGADTLLGFETFFDARIVYAAKKKDIKCVLMPMYECTTPADIKMADLLICPSLLDQEYYPKGYYLPIPVEVPWKQRKTARVFVHNAGHGGLGGRNGTQELLAAMKHVKSPIKLIVRTQQEGLTCDDKRVEIRTGTFDFRTLYEEGDVFVFPEKFNGLSLPLQEAFASGMLIMTTDRFPNHTYLPSQPLIPVVQYTQESISTNFKMAHIDPLDIAKKIDEWYGRDISDFSKQGRKWAREHSWKNLKPKYLELL